MVGFYTALFFLIIIGFWLRLSHKETFRGHIQSPLVIFDFDGTICPSFPLFLNQIDYFNLRALTEAEKEKIKEMSLKELLQFFKVSPLRLPFLIRQAKKNVREHLLELKPVLGMAEILEKLKTKGFFLGILTSNSEENVNAYLKKQGIDLFDFIYTGNNIFGKKKHLKKILKRGKISPQDVIYIGDEIRDMEAAESASIFKGAVTWGYNSKRLLQEGRPHFLCDTPDQLFLEIERIFSEKSL